MDAVPFPHSLPVGDVTPQFFKTGDFYSDSLVACQLCMPLPCVYRAAIIEQVARIVTLDNSDRVALLLLSEVDLSHLCGKDLRAAAKLSGRRLTIKLLLRYGTA